MNPSDHSEDNILKAQNEGGLLASFLGDVWFWMNDSFTLNKYMYTSSSTAFLVLIVFILFTALVPSIAEQARLEQNSKNTSNKEKCAF